MTRLQLAEFEMELVEAAIAAVLKSANSERYANHEKHIDPLYVQALDRLQVKQVGCRAYLSRVQILGE